MGSATTRFFERLTAGPQPSFLERAEGTLRFDLREGARTEHWLVAVGRRGLKVSRQDGGADCIIRCEARVFDEIVEGRMNCMAALLRGLVDIEGRSMLLVLFQRLFAPPTPQGGSAKAGSARSRS